QKPKWKREHSEQLRGAKLVVIPDHDNAGYGHAEATCKTSLGVAKRVRYLTLAEHWPDIPKGGDSSDYLDAPGHSVEQFKTLFEKAPEREPLPPPPPEAKNEAERLLAELNADNCVVLDGARTRVLRFEEVEHDAGGEHIPRISAFSFLRMASSR